jgi:hypothetical protein
MNIILIYYKWYTNIMTSLTNNNFLFFDEDNINYNVEYISAKYESPSIKHSKNLKFTSSKNKPKFCSIPDDNTNKELKELNEKIESEQKHVSEFELENSDKIKEMNDNKELLDKLEIEVTKKTTEIKLMENNITTIKDETQNDIDLRTINERNALNEASLKYNEVKKEYDSLIIPDRIDPPRRNAPKDAEAKYEKYNTNRENIRIMKNRLANVMRNKEIDVETATQKLAEALKGPSKKEQLCNKLKQMRKDFDESIQKLNQLRNSYRDKLITKYKLDKLYENINLAIAAKEKYERRGLSVISKNGITNYDDNGNIIKKAKLDLTNFYKELKNLEDNPPMKDEVCYNLNVKTEFDFLVEYYRERSSMIQSYLPNINTLTLTDDHKWAMEANNDLKSVKLKIEELKKNLYTGDVWTTIDYDKYNVMKQDIYKKYNHRPETVETQKEKTYTMDDFIKSLKA